MTNNWEYMANYDFTAQIDNLADAAELLYKAARPCATNGESWIANELALREADELVLAIGRLRQQWLPVPVVEGTSA